MHFKQEPVLSAKRAELLRLQLVAETYKQRVGERIREARERKQWTQPQLSRAMPPKVTPAYISRWETGAAMPGTQYLELLADALEVDVSFFLVSEPQEETPDLMGALNGNGPEGPADKIVSLLEQQNQLLADVAEALGDLMAQLAVGRAETSRGPKAKPSGRRKAAGS